MRLEKQAQRELMNWSREQSGKERKPPPPRAGLFGKRKNATDTEEPSPQRGSDEARV
jgi:hypothetical protein